MKHRCGAMRKSWSWQFYLLVEHNGCTVSHLSSNNLGGRTCLARKWFHRADTSTQPAKHVGGTGGGGGKIGCKKW